MDNQQPMQMQGQMPQQMMDPSMGMNMMDQPMMQGGAFGNDGFSAKPQLLKNQKKKFRDPYREYV